MLHYESPTYILDLNERAGTLVRLRQPGDNPLVNLAHIDLVSAFGMIAYTRKDCQWYKEADPTSPHKIERYVFEELHSCARCLEHTEKSARFKNDGLQYTVDYEFYDQGFDICLNGEMSEADMVAFDVNVPMNDLRQNDSEDYQFVAKAFRHAAPGVAPYLYLEVPDESRGLLVYGAEGVVGWRLRYLEYQHFSIVAGVQMVVRWPKMLTGQENDGPVSARINCSYHKSLEEALEYLSMREKAPRLKADVLGAFAGSSVTFSVQGASRLSLTKHDGETTELPLDCRSVILPEEGFYTLRAENENGKADELTFHAGKSYSEVLRRSSAILEPKMGDGAIEGWYWLHSWVIAHNLQGDNKYADSWIADAIYNVLGQGQTWKGTPELPLVPKGSIPGRYDNLVKDGDIFMYVPYPKDTEVQGRKYSPYHLYKYMRLQDAFGFAEMLIDAGQAYHSQEIIDFAAKIALAHIHDHQNPNGKMACRCTWQTFEADYTTVLPLSQNITKVACDLRKLGDPRWEELANSAIAIAEYLMERGFEFPSEGYSLHLRFTADCSMSSSAISLLTVYKYLKQDKRYLDRALAILESHGAWDLYTSDVRERGTSFRYWDTQWEADGEGRDINAGHAWTLLRGEAWFLLGEILHDSQYYVKSYNAYQSNFAKCAPNGNIYSSFITDMMPQRLLEPKLYHCYPKKKDVVLAWYFWPSLSRTWLTKAVLYEDADGQVKLLNGRLGAVTGESATVDISMLGKDAVLVNLTSRKVVYAPADK